MKWGTGERMFTMIGEGIRGENIEGKGLGGRILKGRD